MIPVNKVMNFIFKMLFNLFINGKWYFLCITCSTFITVALLCLKMELRSNHTTKGAMMLHNNYVHNEQIYVTMATRKITKSLNEIMRSIPEVNKDIIFFNSISKSGGELLVLLLQWLQDLNGFKHVRLPSIKQYNLNRYEQEDIVQAIMNEVRNGALPYTFDRQVQFINFTSFGHQSPTFLSLVRDPIDRAIAKFHFDQVTPTPPFYYNSRVDRLKRKADLHNLIVKEFEKCVLHEEARCKYSDGMSYELTIPYFCGYDVRCTNHNDKWALNQAKQNVERYYPVVGVLEDINTTLAVLETRLPQFFKDVVKVYGTQLSKKHKAKELFRPMAKLNKRVKKILKQQLTTEYEFYYYLRNRLSNQRAI